MQVKSQSVHYFLSISKVFRSVCIIICFCGNADFITLSESPAPTPVANAAISPATSVGSTPVTPSQTYKPTAKIKDEEKILAEFKVSRFNFLF